MKPALTIIAHIMESTGMNTLETNRLLARFLQEEAFDFVEIQEEGTEAADHTDRLSGTLS